MSERPCDHICPERGKYKACEQCDHAEPHQLETSCDYSVCDGALERPSCVVIGTEKDKVSEQENGKHTPGDWTVDGLYIIRNGTQPTGLYTVAICADPTARHIDGEIKERVANAHLIAAAPDLLEALLYLLEHPTTADVDSDEAMRCVFARKKARIAIAKARGEV